MVSPVRPSVALDGEDAVLFSDAIVAHLLLSVNLIARFWKVDAVKFTESQ
jgi:hypothetical protein